ncbi:hypothetical protein [Kitasatospora sp. MAP5-34]|uniref:hypothetical protein n=1 Tax=Kitasatospora sp. MAP5-34 TaxID=3035102 RepID=UPI0024734A95|nr:hypothetical protein [Kitasatospora sp. MAP5-34]MDH6575082.1 hypothetical protein [Kitasatospora sp. MAP5-34]
MMSSHPALRPSGSRPTSGSRKGDADTDTLDSLVSTSRRMGRFWPSSAAHQEPAAATPVGVSVPTRTQRLVAGMPEYGG